MMCYTFCFLTLTGFNSGFSASGSSCSFPGPQRCFYCDGRRAGSACEPLIWLLLLQERKARIGLLTRRRQPLIFNANQMVYL